ncbi:hypothetical protein NHN26_07100 [Rhodovulum tesquicola]|uniref:hypothetical protein n=1 Tax=Rhodovulum tesquicola TaxID=540254 RepID=UPI002097AB2F|nr:hypothetical protein [Rhodovulum tesquicola]MCO8144989.1 hypothetical protein [Rhodovulum tesquicola]
MNNNTLLIGGVVVAAAFAFVVTQKRSGTEDAEIESRVAALNDRIGELESSLAEVTERADAQAAVIAETATLGSRLAETVQGLGEVSGSVAQTAAAPAPAEAPEAAPETAAAAAPGTGVGETAILADGAIRAFVSRVDAAGQMARLSMNGMMSDIAAGRSVTLAVDGQTCDVTADAIADGKVSLSAECAATATESAAAPAGIGDGTGIAVGETAIFGDGAVRVFLSRVDAAAGTARIAVNGLATTTLAVGESVEADGACSVALGGVEGNRASLGYACGS